MNSVINLSLLAISTILSVVIAEGVFFAVNFLHASRTKNDYNAIIESVAVYDGQVAQDLDFFQYHPIYGHIGVPGIEGSLGGFRTSTNSKGYRDSEHAYAKPADTKRVLLLGDSEVWGIGTHDNETLTYHLTQVLNTLGSNQKHEVISLGVSGYGFDQSFLQFLVEGLYYNPDYVVLVFFGENDVAETASSSAWGIEKPRFFVQQDSLCLTNVPPKRASGWSKNKLGKIFERAPQSVLKYGSYLQKSNIIGFFKNREISSSLWGALSFRGQKSLDSGGQADPFDRLAQQISCFEKTPSEQALSGLPALELSLKIIATLAQKAKNNGTNLLIVGKPPFDEYAGTRRPNSEYSLVLNGLTKLGIPYIDLLDIGKAKNILPNDFFSVSSHLSSMGHYEAAQAIKAWMYPTEN